MLDLILLIIAGLSQLGLAYLGFRVATKPPKTKKWRIRTETTFVALGVIGFIAIVWSGVRSAEIQTATSDGIQQVLAILRGRPPAKASPVRDPNALYQDGEIVAQIQGGIIDQPHGSVRFMTLSSNGKGNPQREMEYQDWVVLCPGLPIPPPNTIVGNFTGLAVGANCQLVRRRP
jgi:hypothetical protein